MTPVRLHPQRGTPVSNRAAAWPVLTAGEVHVWFLKLEAHITPEAHLLLNDLSDDERRRAARYAFERDRAQFIACRGALRSVLGAYLGRPARSIAFQCAAGGKPSLVRPGRESRIEFNISHTQGIGVMAFACDRPVGVDVEQVREMPWSEAIAARYFSPADRAAIGRAAPADRPLVFHRIWTGREAALKASGEGLAGLSPAPSGACSVPTTRRLDIPSHNCVASVAAAGTWQMKCLRLESMLSIMQVRRSA